MKTEKIEEFASSPRDYVLDTSVLESIQVKYQTYFDKHNQRMKAEFGNYFNAYLTPEMELLSYFEDLELRDDLLQGKTILDIGSANHFFDDYCKQKYGSNVVAVDIDTSSIGKQHELGVIADARMLPFADESFDLIISHASMPHVLVPNKELKLKEKLAEDVLSMFRNAYRITKKGGQIRMSTFSEFGEEEHIKARKENNLLPFITDSTRQQISRIKLIKEALIVFEKETGARCIFKDEDSNGLIIITKI